MERAKLIMMTVSLVFVAMCFGASVYFTVALPSGDENLAFFYVADFIFGASAVWFGFNVCNLMRNR